MNDDTEKTVQRLHSEGLLDREIADELNIDITDVFDARNSLDLKPNGKARASDEQLYNAWEEGLSLKEIAAEFGYANISNISYRLRRIRDEPYTEKVKLSRVGESPSRIISLKGSEISKAGFDPSKDLEAKKVVEEGKIVLELVEAD